MLGLGLVLPQGQTLEPTSTGWPHAVWACLLPELSPNPGSAWGVLTAQVKSSAGGKQAGKTKQHLCDGLGLCPAVSRSLVWGSLELVGVYAGIFVIKEFVENDHGK